MKKKENIKNIETLKELEFEKERLRFQIQLSEEKISNNFQSLTDRISFESITNEIKESAIGTIYKAFKLGYNLFHRRKKNSA